MNLYIINETRRGTIFGIGTYVQELVAALKNYNINICVVNIFSDKPQIEKDQLEGIDYWYFPEPIIEQRSIDFQEQRKLYFHNIVYLLKLHIKNKNELIFHLNYQQSVSLVEDLKKGFDCKVVLVSHYSDWSFMVHDNLEKLRNILNGNKIESFSEELKRSFEEEKLYCSRVDRCICLSNYMQEIMCHYYELDMAKISVIPNGLRDVTDTSINIKLLRKKWQIPVEEKIIIFAGRLDKIKGLEYLIKAFQSVLVTYPQCRLIIAGTGDFNKFTKEAQNVCTKITYTGHLDKIQLYEWYSMADIGVVPSLFEPFGYVALEMMMHSLPVVATATSGLNEILDSNCSLKVPLVKKSENVEIDTDLLAQKILYLLLHPNEKLKLGENGRKRYKMMYTSEIFAQNMFNFYQSLI